MVCSFKEIAFEVFRNLPLIRRLSRQHLKYQLQQMSTQLKCSFHQRFTALFDDDSLWQEDHEIPDIKLYLWFDSGEEIRKDNKRCQVGKPFPWSPEAPSLEVNTRLRDNADSSVSLKLHRKVTGRTENLWGRGELS